jgi:hypothetical protein
MISQSNCGGILEGMGMPSSENVLQPATLRNRPASRYEALSRLAEVIRSRPDEKDLFQTLANELHEVVEFDAIWQLDATANWIQWHLVEPFDQRLNAIHLQPVTKEETVSWWVYENQQPVVLRLSDPETVSGQAVTGQAGINLNIACNGSPNAFRPYLGLGGITSLENQEPNRTPCPPEFAPEPATSSLSRRTHRL